MRPLSRQLRGTNFRELRARCRRLFVLPGVFSGNVQNEGDCWSVNGRLYAGDGAFPRRQSDAEATALRSDNEAALAAKRLAETQSTELTRLVTRLEAQVEELMGQRDAAGKREAGIEAARQALEKRLQTLQSTADTERERLLQHIRAVEDRANTEVDRMRQEAKDLQGQVKELGRTHTAAEKAARQLLDKAIAEAKDAQRELSLQRNRAEAAESRLGQLQEVSAAVEAAIRRAGATQRENSGRKVAPSTPRKRFKIASGK